MENEEAKIEEWSSQLALLGEIEYSENKAVLLQACGDNQRARQFIEIILELAELKRQDRRAREERLKGKPVIPVWQDLSGPLPRPNRTNIE